MYQPNYHPKLKAANVSDTSLAQKDKQADIEKIGARLIACLRKSIPKINCDRLKLNQQVRRS